MSWSEPSRRGVLGLLAALPAAACGFAPLYGDGAPAAKMAGRVDVAPVEAGLDSRPAFDMHEALTRRLGTAADPTYRLVVTLSLRTTGTALTQENVTTRFDVLGSADYKLVPLAGGPAVTSGTVRSVTGFNAPDSVTSTAFAARAAELDARHRLAVALADQIVQRLALSAAGWT